MGPEASASAEKLALKTWQLYSAKFKSRGGNAQWHEDPSRTTSILADYWADEEELPRAPEGVEHEEADVLPEPTPDVNFFGEIVEKTDTPLPGAFVPAADVAMVRQGRGRGLDHVHSTCSKFRAKMKSCLRKSIQFRSRIRTRRRRSKPCT